MSDGPYRIYRNLNKHCWSVQHRPGYGIQGWRVLQHMEALVATDVTFHVSLAGRERVRASGHKNVHAYILTPRILTPTEVEAHQPPLDPWEEITYDPRDDIPSFHITPGTLKVTSGTAVLLTADGRAFGHNVH